MASIARVFGEPEDDWIRITGRGAASGLPRLSPPVRPRMDRLPLGELTPSEFERFTSYLLKAAYPSATVSRAGGQGHTQHGADIHVRTSDGIHLFQCKRVQRFGPAQMKKAAEAAAESNTKKRVIVLSRVASPEARSTAEDVGWDIWDHDDVVRMIQLEVSPEQARRVLEVFFPMLKEDFLGIRGGGPWACPDEFFAGQRKDSPFSHSYELVGREDEVAKVLDWVRGCQPFFLLTGAAGVGKSRFLMEVARCIDAAAGRPVVYFVDKNASVDLEHFQRFGDDRPIIVVDDAHDRDDLGEIIRGARVRSGQYQRARVLFATREYGKPGLVRALAEHAHELAPPRAHLAPLTSADARQLASRVLGAPENSPSTRRLVAVTRDCTLFLVAAGYLLKTKHVDPSFLDDEENFRVAVLERMYNECVRGVGHVADDISVAKVLRFLAAVHPLDLASEDSLEAASRVICCRRDVLTSALGEIVKTGVVVKRGSRLRLQPDLLADHILVSACFDRTLGRTTGYADCVWQAGSDELRRNLVVNVARIDWRLSKTGVSPESMLSAAWGVLERDFKAGGISQRLYQLDLLEEIAFYQPERTLDLVKWALDHELPPEHAEFFGLYTYRDVRFRIAPVLKACAYHYEWLGRACDLLWRLAQSNQRHTNPHHDHPVRILCDLAAYSLYKPFDYTERVIRQAIEWLWRDRAKLVFDFLDQALQKKFMDHISDGYTVTHYASSALVLGERRVLAVRDEVLDAVIQQLGGNDASLAVRAAKSIGLALSSPMRSFGRKPDAEEVNVWDEESVRLLKKIRDELDGKQLSVPVAVALREVVEPAMRKKNEEIAAAAEKVLGTVDDDLEHQVVEVLIHGPWRRHRHWTDREPSPDEARRWLNDLARRFLEDSVETSIAVDGVERHLAEIGAASDAPGAGNFVATLVADRLCVGLEIVHRVITDANSPLAQVTGVTLSVIRVAAAVRALELAQALVNTGLTAARMSVAYAYGWGLATATTVSNAELAVIRELAADDDVKLALELSHGLRFMAEGDPRMALMVILEMRIGRSEQLASEVIRLFLHAGPLRIDKLSNDELDRIVEEFIVCSQIDDYWIQAFLASVSRSDLQRVVRLLQRRVEHAESLGESADYRPFPFRWHEKCRLESRGTQDRPWILEELRDWASKDAPGWRRGYEAPRLFAAVANEFDDEVLGVIELGLMAPSTIASNVAGLLSEVPRCFAWSHVQWIVRILEDAERRDTEVYKAVGDALHTALMSGGRTGTPGEPFPEDVEQRDKARKVADSLPVGSPGERLYRSLQRVAEGKIERRSEGWV